MVPLHEIDLQDESRATPKVERTELAVVEDVVEDASDELTNDSVEILPWKHYCQNF